MPNFLTFASYVSQHLRKQTMLILEPQEVDMMFSIKLYVQHQLTFSTQTLLPNLSLLGSIQGPPKILKCKHPLVA